MSRVALVTVTYNGETVWSEFWSSLVAQKGVDWHLYVIDNASFDGTLEAVRALQDDRVTLVANAENVGVAAANNQGIRLAEAAGADWIVLINNDTTFPENLLANLSGAAREMGAGAVSAVIPYYEHPRVTWYAGGYFSRLRGMLSIHRGQGGALPSAVRPFKTTYAPTCCVLFDPAVFREIGMMDEQYFVYWDDVDFMWRMRSAGVRLYVDPKSILFHKVSVSTGGRQSDFSIRYGHRNQIYFTRKHLGVVYSLYASLLTLLLGAARLLLTSDRLHHFRRRAAAVSEGWRMPLSPVANLEWSAK